MTRILIAPNAFKGSLDAMDAANAIANGLKRSGVNAIITTMPIADGGDGSLPVILTHLGGKLISDEVRGPVGKSVSANWGYEARQGVAIIELAEASGIKWVPREQLNPMMATTYGSGELIAKALAMDAKAIYLSVGGSATVDGGVGILEALGMRFMAGDQVIDHVKPIDFLKLTHIDSSRIMVDTPIRILCDVMNPLLGEEGAATIFGPQKGADQVMVQQLEESLAHMAGLIQACSGRDIRTVVGGGAAGGVAAGLYGMLNAELINGGEQILAWAGFEEHLKSTDLIITGEGKIDRQTNYGKGPGLVAKMARDKGVRVIGLSGVLDQNTSQIKYFDELIQISSEGDTLDVSIAKAATNLEAAAFELGKRL